MMQQQIAERSTPTNSSFGTAIVNSQSIRWTQIVQRNDRRKYAQVIFSNADFFLVNNTDVESDALELATQVNNASNNGTDLVMGNAALYSSAPILYTIETTGPLYVACFNLNTEGAPIVSQGVVAWQESIFSDLDAIPGFIPEHRAKAGDVHNVTTGTLEESILGRNAESPYTRGGIR
jgi:hypothetical protein